MTVLKLLNCCYCFILNVIKILTVQGELKNFFSYLSCIKIQYTHIRVRMMPFKFNHSISVQITYTHRSPSSLSQSHLCNTPSNTKVQYEVPLFILIELSKYTFPHCPLQALRKWLRHRQCGSSFATQLKYSSEHPVCRVHWCPRPH